MEPNMPILHQRRNVFIFCFIHLIANYDNKSRTGSPVRSRLYMGIHYQVILTYLLDPNERAEMEV